MKKLIPLIVSLLGFLQSREQIISSVKTNFDLAAATIYVDANDFSLVKKSAELLQQDIEMITGKKVPVVNDLKNAKGNTIIIGSLEKSSLIKQLARQNKINTKNIVGKWEAYSLQIIKNIPGVNDPKAPLVGVGGAVVIIGSDRRGVAFGVFELSKQIGVSPWYWWADVPAKKQEHIYISNNISVSDVPKVKYRGIFINDEAPALSGWTKEKFGGFNHLFYEKVFELILRLKGNYLWPAMWGNAFYDDDSLNIKSADEYGIVIGTSHHEPLMRAHDEWRRYGSGKWNYDSNEIKLKEFWKTGMQRAWNEKIVSIGMRGDGDEPMTRETATALLERIVKDQREIIAEVTNKPANETPQSWALYKEVQDYYDKGMRVPDDVTLLLCDDNWGNIRKLPKLTDKQRSGGYGIYYHFDYVGGPRNYKWINTNNIARTWEQMHLAYEYGVKNIWIVNVGDIKPMEFPISFFLGYAWNPDKWNKDNLRNYYSQWAAEQFGVKYAKEIGEILRKYSQYASRRKPELLDEKTYNISNDEYQNVVKQWKGLASQAEKINNSLDKQFRDAYFQLVLHPVKAFANLHEMYLNVALNYVNAKGSISSANAYAEQARQLYKNDSLLTLQYHQLANGKWNHMMDQTHIGYTYWQQPPENKMPDVFYVSDLTANDTIKNANYKQPSAKNLIPANTTGNIFYEYTNYVSIEATHYTRVINTSIIHWKVIPDIGRDGDGITTFPVTASEQKPGKNSPHLEYEFYSYSKDSLQLQCYFSPTLNFHNTEEGLRYAVSIDDELPQIISINKEDKTSISGIWNKWVADNIIIKTTNHKIVKPGKHVVKYWMVNSAVILQKLVIGFGELPQTYLGPKETKLSER